MVLKYSRINKPNSTIAPMLLFSTPTPSYTDTIDEETMINYIKNNNQIKIKYLLEKNCILTVKSYIAAAKLNNVNTMKMLMDYGCPADSSIYKEIMNIASVSIDTLEWLYTNEFPINLNDFDNSNLNSTANIFIKSIVLKGEVKKCNKNNVKWFYNNGYTVDYEYVGKECSTEFIEWLENELDTKLFPINSGLIYDGAATNGRLDTMKYLNSHHYDISDKTFSNAIINGNIDNIKWLFEYNTIKLTTNLFNTAAVNGNLEIMKWLNEINCPWNSDTFTNTIRFHKDKQENIVWLIENGCDIDPDIISFGIRATPMIMKPKIPIVPVPTAPSTSGDLLLNTLTSSLAAILNLGVQSSPLTTIFNKLNETQTEHPIIPGNGNGNIPRARETLFNYLEPNISIHSQPIPIVKEQDTGMPQTTNQVFNVGMNPQQGSLHSTDWDKEPELLQASSSIDKDPFSHTFMQNKPVESTSDLGFEKVESGDALKDKQYSNFFNTLTNYQLD